MQGWAAVAESERESADGAAAVVAAVAAAERRRRQQERAVGTGFRRPIGGEDPWTVQNQ